MVSFKLFEGDRQIDRWTDEHMNRWMDGRTEPNCNLTFTISMCP